MKGRTTSRKEWFFVAFLLLLFAGMATYSISVKSITNDELTHIPSGYTYDRLFDYRMNPEHPPLIKMIAGLPLLLLQPHLPTDHPSWEEGAQWVFGAQFLYFQNPNTDQLIFFARLPMILLGVLFGIYVFLFARDLYGKASAFAALTLYAFSPNILAHTRLVATDAGLAGFSLMTIYYLWRYLEKQDQRALWLTGLCFGLTMASKFSAVYLIPIMVVLVVLRLWRTAPKEGLRAHPGLRSSIKALAWMGLVGAAVVVMSYGVVHADQYFKGFLGVVAHSERGHNSYLMGEYSPTGFTWYFPIAFAIKTPISFLTLLLITLLFYRSINKEWKQALWRDAYLLIPAAIFVAAFMMNRINIGLRHILPAYPLLFIFASQSLDIRWKKVTKYAVFGLLLVWYVSASISIAPDYLAYFNGFAGGPDNGYKFLIDSNLDWGQDLKQLGWWLDEQGIDHIKMAYFGKDSRAYRGINFTELRCEPEPGLMAVSVDRLMGFTKKSSECLSWLTKFEPIKTIGHSIFIYDLKEQDIIVPREEHCQAGCKAKCEAELQEFAEAVYEDHCICRCTEVR